MATPRFQLVRRGALLPAALVVAAMAPLVAQTPPAAQPAPARPPAAAPRQEAARPEAARPEPVRRVVVTAATAPAYSCAAATCKVVAELEKGAALSVLKTEGDFHQVMVRTGATAMTTGWVKASQVTASATEAGRSAGPAASAATLPGTPAAGANDPDPRGCLTCLATRQATRDEWDAALADTATKKGRPETDRPVTPGLADGRTSDERMRDRFTERYGAEVNRLAGVAGSVDGDLTSYLAACFERYASIKVEGAAPRRTAVDDILAAARASRGAARFAVWSGSPGFAWSPEWASQTNENSSLPSCERRWTDAIGRADRLKIDLEMLERDAMDHDIYPGVVREQLAARGLAEGSQQTPTAPVVDVR